MSTSSVFISYSHDDLKQAEGLQYAFQSAGVAVHRDADGFRYGDEWFDKAKSMVSASDCFLLLWSKASAKSIPVMREVMFALDKKKRLLTVLIDETPPLEVLSDSIYIKLKSFNGMDELARALLLDFAKEGIESTSPIGVSILSAISSYNKAAQLHFKEFKVLLVAGNAAIDKAYVALGLTEGLDLTAAGGAELTTRSIAEAMGAEKEGLILAGHPGSGKSSTLQYLAYTLASQAGNSLTIYARLMEFDAPRHVNLISFLAHAVQRVAPNKRIIDVLVSKAAFDALTVNLLLDGLDELPEDGYRQLLLALRTFHAEYPSVRLLISTRIDGFRDAREADFSGWRKLTITKLDGVRVREFVDCWFRDKPSDAEALLRVLSNPRLAELAGRTFLLALICLGYQKDQVVGVNRSAIYQRAVEYLEYKRRRHHTEKEISNGRTALKQMALRALQMGMLELPQDFAIAFTKYSTKIYDEKSCRDLLVGLALETGLIQIDGDTFGFTHRSLLEFFAASEISDDVRGEEMVLANCQAARWEEPIRLYAGTRKSKEQQERLVERLWAQNPALALRVASECGQVASNFLAWLIQRTHVSVRVRMLNEVRRSLSTLDRSDAQRIVVETVRPLFSVEKDSAVLHAGIELVKQFDPTDIGGVMHEFFYDPKEAILKKINDIAGDVFKFVHVPAGWFRMGDDSQAAEKLERPVHDVFVAEFEVGAYQVTNKIFEIVMGLDQSRRDRDVSDGDNDPVTQVTWYDAFVCALRAGCRLPTEAEWEYMARAGTNTQWCFGNDETELKRYANYHPTGPGRTWPVGAALPNSWGIFDIHGNVWEWCSDWLATYSAEKQESPLGPTEGTARVRRGGGHGYHSKGCRSSFRWGNDPEYKFKDIGFRLVRAAI